MVGVPGTVDVGQLTGGIGLGRRLTDGALHVADRSPVGERGMIAIQVAGGDGATGTMDQSTCAAMACDRLAAITAGEGRKERGHVPTLLKCAPHRRMVGNESKCIGEEADAGFGAVPGGRAARVGKGDRVHLRSEHVRPGRGADHLGQTSGVAEHLCDRHGPDRDHERRPEDRDLLAKVPAAVVDLVRCRSSITTTAVSYTHLTLPTSDLV